MTIVHLMIATLLSVGTISCQMTTTSESRSVNPDAENTSTGLSGRIMVAAPCPGPVTDEPCPDQPLAASFEVLDAQNKVVAHFESDDKGHFQLVLPPGTYTIVLDASAPLFNARSQRRPVTVQDQQMTEVTLRFDSGMR